MSKIKKKERQDFIDEVAKGLFIYDERCTPESAYSQAESLWNERERRLENENNPQK